MKNITRNGGFLVVLTISLDVTAFGLFEELGSALDSVVTTVATEIEKKVDSTTDIEEDRNTGYVDNVKSMGAITKSEAKKGEVSKIKPKKDVEIKVRKINKIVRKGEVAGKKMQNKGVDGVKVEMIAVEKAFNAAKIRLAH
jgi:hypothetical protein